ncbi:hypothetical protein BX666DRAFT_1947400 [Dichotomocladium elegans]|nr:hypothetical protein BX666DRAFT_1947400 [Dichotomocladium elegans]
MSDALDMSTASMISQQSSRSMADSQDLQSSSHSSSLPSPPSPRSLIMADSEPRRSMTVPFPESLENQPLPPSPPPPPPSRPLGSTAWAVIRSSASTIANHVFRDNNLPLLVNAIYHLAAARQLLQRPASTMDRYVYIPVSQQKHKSALAATSLATDALRMVGAMHLALGVLAGLVLKERRIGAERQALLVLTLASVGQAWAHARGYYESSRNYTLKALQEIGTLDTMVMLISGIAWSKTVRRTGRWL